MNVTTNCATCGQTIEVPIESFERRSTASHGATLGLPCPPWPSAANRPGMSRSLRGADPAESSDR